MCGPFISADLSEALKLSDVIAVMYEGEIVAYFDNTEGLNEEKLGLYMLGLKGMARKQIRRGQGMSREQSFNIIRTVVSMGLP